MEDGGGMVRLHDAWGLDYGEHLLVWALRRRVFHCNSRPGWRASSPMLAGAGGAEAPATLRVLLDLAGPGGALFVGTPRRAPPVLRRPRREEHVHEWSSLRAPSSKGEDATVR